MKKQKISKVEINMINNKQVKTNLIKKNLTRLIYRIFWKIRLTPLFWKISLIRVPRHQIQINRAGRVVILTMSLWWKLLQIQTIMNQTKINYHRPRKQQQCQLQQLTRFQAWDQTLIPNKVLARQTHISI